MTEIAPSLDRRTWLGWLLVGFALGGFFDGILLHQILQWHHLLSALADPQGSDLRFQIMADGLFHLLMYLVAVAGAVLLVAGRASHARAGTTSEILRLAMAGFGSWHVLDALFSHWLLGLHRIRMDSAAPLAWDLVWLAVFGILPLLLAVLLPNRGGPARGAGAALMGVTLFAGLAAGAGPRANAETLVLFRAEMQPAARMQAVLAAGSALKGTDASGAIWAIEAVSWSGLTELYARGALAVGATPVLAGCLAWTSTRIARL